MIILLRPINLILNVGPSNLVLLKTYTTEFNDIVITFTDQNGNKEKINKTNK